MSDWFQRIRDSFDALRQPLCVLEAGAGRWLLSPHGARVLGCALPGLSENPLWHNPELEHPDWAGAALSAAGRHFGGDRLWLSPAVAYLQPSPGGEDPTRIHMPSQLDPGHYFVLDQTDTLLALESHLTLSDHRSGQSLSVRIGRRVHAVSPPRGLPAGLLCSGFAVQNELFLMDGEAGCQAGGWNVTQVPLGGVAVLPGDDGEPSGGEGCDGGRCVVMCAGQRRRLAVDAAGSPGRLGYVRQVGDQTVGLVRVFAPQPGEVYAAAGEDPDAVDGPAMGGAAYPFMSPSGVDGQPGPTVAEAVGDLGGFVELRHHEPALVVGEGPMVRCASHVTHVFAGSAESVQLGLSGLLGAAAAGLMTVGG